METGDLNGSTNLTQHKDKLRRQMNLSLGAVPAETLSMFSEQLCRILAQCKELNTPGTTVAIFAAHNKEVDLSALHQLIPHTRLTYPLCHPDKQLNFHHVTSPSELSPGAYGIREPDADKHPQVLIENIDLIICPGLAFGRDGTRLGYGGGYYDRALSRRPPTTLVWGACLDLQLCDSLPQGRHDQPVALIATELCLTPATTS